MPSLEALGFTENLGWDRLSGTARETGCERCHRFARRLRHLEQHYRSKRARARNLISQAAEASVAGCVEESTRSNPAEAVEAEDAAGMPLAAAPAHGPLVCAAVLTLV